MITATIPDAVENALKTGMHLVTTSDGWWSVALQWGDGNTVKASKGQPFACAGANMDEALAGLAVLIEQWGLPDLSA